MQTTNQSDRRWCKQCGLASPSEKVKCIHCESAFQRISPKVSQNLLSALQNSPFLEEEVDVDAFIASLQDDPSNEKRMSFYLKWIGLAVFFIMSIVWSDMWIRFFELTAK